ncbi:protein amun [Lycorma delicatula]|uniref:protein amun n=1 Tax=Lycorma delicatula TaxID=130591 RepID=UPI003F514B0A
MASVRDTATFFTEGSANQFEHVLSLYPQALRLKAERKNKKPEELIKLDNWYQNELPKKIKSRGKEAHLNHEELVQLMKWKQARGKFYPQLSYLIKVNTPRAVMNETKKAFRKLPNLEHAINALSNLKGVGTTMASALLAAAAPDKAPFMADECLMAIPDIEGIDYTTKEYLNFVTHIQTTVERLNKESSNGWWSPHRVELALWTHYIASELKPDLLDGIPNGNTPHQNGDTNSNNSTQDALINPTQPSSDGLECSDESNVDSTANGAEGCTALEDPTVDETTTTSFPEEDSLPPSASASVSASASDQDSSLQEEPPTKKTKQDK